MKFTIPDIAQSPHYYPQALDLAGDRVMLIPLSEADYRVSSFLDDRILMPGMTATWVPGDQLAIAAKHINPLPLHFIFHAGHVGSTLLSRLLDELPGVLGLREPVPLRVLADSYDNMGLAGVAAFDARLRMFLNLWARGFADTKTVIVKATSIAARIAPVLLSMLPGSRAIYLNLAAESYIAAILAAGPDHPDVRGFSTFRYKRLAAVIGEAPPTPQGPGELAATAWLTERLNQQVTQNMTGARVLAVDFEYFLENLEETLAKIASHLELRAKPVAIAKAAKSGSLTRYSKAPATMSFSPEHRKTLIAKARHESGGQIARGLAFLEKLAKQNKDVGAVL